MGEVFTESPDIIHGRLLESVHVTGYTMSRACVSLEYLLEDDRWKTLGDGFDNIDKFIKTINLEQFKIAVDKRQRLVKKLDELHATQRATAKALGVSQPTVHNDLKPDKDLSKQPVVTDTPSPLKDSDKDLSPEPAPPMLSMDGTDAAEKLEKVTRGKKRGHLSEPNVKSAGKAQLLCGDAEHLPLDPDTVDVIITSPPYNLGSEHWPMGIDRTPRDEGIGYEDERDEPKYQAWQIRCLIDWHRVAKDGASLFYNHKVRQKEGTIIHPITWLLSQRNPWVIRQEIIWDRTSTHNHCSVLFWPHDERIYWLTKGKPILPEDSIGESTIWRFHGPTPNTWHPAPFSEELPKRCLEAIGRPGIVVLDPFGGSMTTCRVASAMGYESIGVDLNKEYIEKVRAAQNE